MQESTRQIENGITYHFTQRLFQRFGIYTDKDTRAKILIAISKKEAKYLWTSGNKMGFKTHALGPEMIVVLNSTGILITCDRVESINAEDRRKKNGRY